MTLEQRRPKPRGGVRPNSGSLGTPRVALAVISAAAIAHQAPKRAKMAWGGLAIALGTHLARRNVEKRNRAVAPYVREHQTWR